MNYDSLEITSIVFLENLHKYFKIENEIERKEFTISEVNRKKIFKNIEIKMKKEFNVDLNISDENYIINKSGKCEYEIIRKFGNIEVWCNRISAYFDPSSFDVYVIDLDRVYKEVKSDTSNCMSRNAASIILFDYLKKKFNMKWMDNIQSNQNLTQLPQL